MPEGLGWYLAEQRRKKEKGRRQRSSWQSGGSWDGSPAKTKQSGRRIEAIADGSDGNRRGDGHSHIASNDGVNASYLRIGDEVVVDDLNPNDAYEGRNERH